MRRPFAFFIAAASLVAAAAPALTQQEIEDHFRGKTLTVIIPTSPGGDRSANALALINHIGRHIPGNPRVVPNYMPGAGGLSALNHLSNVAAKDGLTLATPLTTLIVAQVTGEKAVRYDVSKMHWIGRTSESTQVLYVWHKLPVHSLQEATKREVTVGSTGVNSPSTIIPQIMNNVFGTKFKVVLGYKGSADFNLATARGETDASLTTWSNLRNSHADAVREKHARILFQVLMTRHPELADIPTAYELAKNDDDRALIEFMTSSAELGQAFIAPPDVPPQIIEALRRAFDLTMQDTAYIEYSRKVGNALTPMPGAELAKFAARTLATPKSVIDRYTAATTVR
jgi:tripartite-type tricarboxylate transporter receptor subunit TctC